MPSFDVKVHGRSFSVERRGDGTFAIPDEVRLHLEKGSALKPAWEPICLARKPLSEPTVAANVLRWGTGAINVAGCRVSFENDRADPATNPLYRKQNGYANGNASDDGSNSFRLKDGSGDRPASPLGRWPANLCHDGSAEVLAAFPDNLTSGTGAVKKRTGEGWQGSAYGKESRAPGTPNVEYGDTGSAARFFYSAKADADDRIGSKHPTVKPVDLMQWLVRLITPPGGLVLDPFAGTGTTGEATWREGFNAALIERETEYQADIARRMQYALGGPDERKHAILRAKNKVIEAGPLFEIPEAAE